VPVLSERDREAVRELLEPVRRETKILFFRSDGPGCRYCGVIEELLRELSSINPCVVFEVLDADGEEAREYGVERAPTILFADRPNVRFLGAPAGREFRTFLEAIVSVSTGRVDLDPAVAVRMSCVDVPVELLVFFTPECPYCPAAVRTAVSFALLNKSVRAVAVEAEEFPDLTERYRVYAVPRVVVRDLRSGRVLAEWEGAVPPEVFADRILGCSGSHVVATEGGGRSDRSDPPLLL